jgi:hypothetical protein
MPGAVWMFLVSMLRPLDEGIPATASARVHSVLVSYYAALGSVTLPVDILAVLIRGICANAGFVNDLRDWLQACWMANRRMWVFNQVDLMYALVIGRLVVTTLIYPAWCYVHVTLLQAH